MQTESDVEKKKNEKVKLGDSGRDFSEYRFVFRHSSDENSESSDEDDNILKRLNIDVNQMLAFMKKETEKKKNQPIAPAKLIVNQYRLIYLFA
jgi:hypothetical protein